MVGKEDRAYEQCARFLQISAEQVQKIILRNVRKLRRNFVGFPEKMLDKSE